MDFEKIKKSAFEAASYKIAQELNRRSKEPKSDLSQRLSEQEPELSKLVEHEQELLIKIQEICIATIKEYHTELVRELN